MKYSDIVGVNENFQYSVNLQFDINNIDKIKEYIPTKDGCELLKKYIESIVNGKNRATTLVGPYGKGKSHLLLVLITLLNDYEENDIKYIDEFIVKIRNIDEELYDTLKNIRERKLRLMPVIINSNYGDLNQAFLLALSEALEREKLSDVIVNTYFDVAIKVIEKWEEKYQVAVEDFKKCLKEYNCSLKDLKKGLKNYSEEYYEIFKNVYSCILHGQEFNPLVNSDIIKTYKDMTHEITKYSYTGIFIVFDEFSKFLEYVENSHMMKDLKLLQDFAELANRTGSNEQIHLSCITHKTINQYAHNLDEDKANAFKTVEGRFKELYFNRSIEQNYEIVSYALQKKEDFDKYYKQEYSKNISVYNDIKKIKIFENIENIEEVLYKGCFPLNPITVFALIQLSEKIAQNERTLFTFLTDDDSNSLKSFIKQNGDGLFNINNVYDYFKPLFKKDIDSSIKDVWMKSENALSKVKEKNEINIIKSLSIIYMIGEIETLIPDDVTIRLSLDLTNEEYMLAINSLIEKSIIKRKKITDELEFSTIYNRELSKEVKRLVENQFYDINIKDTLNEVINKSYCLPRRYNEEYKITRFFKNVYLSEKELLSFSDFGLILENEYCDGIIINLIRESRNIQEIREHFSKIDNNKVVLSIPKTIFSKNLINILKEYKAINYMIKENSGNDEIGTELNLMLKETVEAIEEQVTLYFDKENIQEYIYRNNIERKVKNVSSYLSDICANIYNKTPIINNEMINKKDLTAPIKKARDIVIDTILLNDQSLIKSKTSAEATIYKAIVEKKNSDSIKDVIEVINKFIEQSENTKISFSKLYSILTAEPYSIRKGIIPILIAMSLYNFSDIIVIYFMNKEIDLDSSNLIKINDNPEKYYIHTEKGTTDKIKYLSNLMYLYGVPNLDTQRINLKKLVDTMRRWILSLPRIIREYTYSGDFPEIKEAYITIKDELLRPDINNNEFIYTRLFEILNTNNYENVIAEISAMKDYFDKFIENYYRTLIRETKNVFDSKFKGSITSLLKEWYSNNELENSKRIYDIKARNFIEYIKNLTTHDENDVVEKISKIMTGYYIEDWQPSDIETYMNSIKEVIQEVKNGNDKSSKESNRILLIDGNEKIEKYLTSNDNISVIGNTMKNNIEEIISEYGNSLSEEEKISVLVDIIKNYM